MAAYAALASLAQTIEPILLHDQQATPQEKQLVQSLHQQTVFLQSFLEDFPQAAGNLEERIRDVAYQTEDTIECFMWEQIQSYYASKPAETNEHNRSIMYTELRKSHNFEKLYHELEIITDENINPIVKQVEIVANSHGIKEEQLPSDSSIASTSSASASSLRVASSVGKDVVVGLDDELMVIKDRLCVESSKLQVIPIFGMGGIGKTTLARNAYYDSLVLEWFHIRAWATVSQDYNAREIFQSLLVNIKGSDEEYNTRDSNEMMEYVYKGLKGRRYLIVIDDVWSTDAWDMIRRVLPDDKNGSRIILTTRLEDVAAYADSHNRIHEMHFLDEGMSWSLFRKKIGSYPHELENIGKTIARSCKGLPLAVVVVAGLLSTIDQSEVSWKNVADNINKVVVNSDRADQIVEILSLSYNNLPHRLRPCFLYLGGFPEDRKIRVSQLIKLWVAEGFLKASGSKSLEEQAEGCLSDLVKRSLVLVDEKKSNGKIKICSMHDSLRDMCIRKAKEEKFLLYGTDRNIRETLPQTLESQRRMHISGSGLELYANKRSSSLRSILYFSYYIGLSNSFEGFRMLKMIHALEAISYGFPSEVLKLFHLKYLALKLDYIGEYDSDEYIDWEYNYNKDIYLPEEIERLQKLQTLIVEPCVVLSAGVFRMPELRHIVSKKIVFPSLPAQGHLGMENLRTLGCVLNFKCGKKLLRISRNIKKLVAFYHRITGEVRWSDYKLENLGHMHQLESLELTVSAQCCQTTLGKNAIVFPASLKKIALEKCNFLENMGMVGSLPNLEVLKLKDFAYRGSVWETREGEFPRLKFLSIDQSWLKTWITESSSHFPMLERLFIRRCKYLRGIPEEIGAIPTLELIDVDVRDKYVVESARRIQEEQQSMGNEALQVHFTEHDLQWWETK